MNALTLHCGAEQVDRQQIIDVQTPMATGSHYPVPHIELVDLVKDTVGTLGVQIEGEAHGLTKDGNRYFGILGLDSPHDDFRLVIGIRNSHDKSITAAVSMGSQVFVCDNLAFTGEHKIARKHTRHIMRDLPGMASRVIAAMVASRKSMEQRVEAYKATDLTDSQVNDLLIATVDTGALPVTKLPHVLKEWREPQHPEFEARTAWSLFNCYTEKYKDLAPAHLVKRSSNLHGVFDTACNLHLGIAS